MWNEADWRGMDFVSKLFLTLKKPSNTRWYLLWNANAQYKMVVQYWKPFHPNGNRYMGIPVALLIALSMLLVL